MDYVVPAYNFQGVEEVIRYCKENIKILAESSFAGKVTLPRTHAGFPTEFRAFIRAGGKGYNSADVLVDGFYLEGGKVIKRVLDKIVFGLFPRYKEVEVLLEDIPFESYHPRVLVQVAMEIEKASRNQFQ